MKLPPLSADHALGPPLAAYQVATKTRHHGGTVRPQATLACLTSAVGDADTANVCSLQCGADLSCWEQCAGITDTKALAACFQS
jgi:hypothetical protein